MPVSVKREGGMPIHHPLAWPTIEYSAKRLRPREGGNIVEESTVIVSSCPSRVTP